MISITNANAIINILSITESCREYIGYLLLTTHRRVLQLTQDPEIDRGGVELLQLIFNKRCHKRRSDALSSKIVLRRGAPPRSQQIPGELTTISEIP